MEAASKLMASLVKTSVFTSEVTQKERELKSEKKCLQWKRFVMILLLVDLYASTGSLLNHLSTIRDRKEEEARLRLKILGRQAAENSSKNEKKKYVRPETMPMTKGHVMTRSEEKVWRLSPEECTHPPEELSQPRAAGTKKWFTCLACGQRWARIHEWETEIDPKANWTAEELATFKEIPNSNRDLNLAPWGTGRFPSTPKPVGTHNNPADEMTKMTPPRDKSSSSNSTNPKPAVPPLLTAPEARKRVSFDADDSHMTIVLTPLAEKMRLRYLELMTKESMSHEDAVMWMLTNASQSEPTEMKALQELLQYLANDV